MSERLSQATLGRLPANVERFGYDRRRAAAGVVHLGIGAFHRAHQAALFDRLNESDPRWAIRAASLRSPGVRDEMAPQDGLYAMVVREGGDDRVRVIGAVREVLVAPEDPRTLVEALAAPEVRLVTLTVTEKGYRQAPDDPEAPRTAAGFIAAGLNLRRSRGLAPFAALSCDNLPDNGARLREAVLAVSDPELGDWIGAHVAFPKTMVDRIVPATDEADIASLARHLGLVDRAMVKTEPFWQWVIEDFPGDRPDFESIGVQMTSDVAPWEDAKLRLLNGAHSAIAYLGGLAGTDFVHQFVADPAGRSLVESLWDEAQATLDPPPGLDLPGYREALMRRFSNASLQHRTRQIAMDGSQKLPQRLLAPIADRLRRGQAADVLILAVAAWMRWQSGCTDAGEPFTVDDPLASQTGALLRSAHGPAEQAKALLRLDLFPRAMAEDERFVATVTRQLERLCDKGARAVVKEIARR
ncbi:mannitol dehydrogenase family protein [Sphingosinicella terrae]|uniref:mannitol dehydrogenase family protein n=1 Tax=Sphingosinicella terrae TaxID=2172047 RepID=UPI000E0D6592|nr:mannitol dehydrogenase family protein [Sphingosinicella terrae]